MKNKNKPIVYGDTDIPSIYFPVGIPPKGTCCFATKKCKEYCPSGMVVYDHEKYVLKFFRKEIGKKIARKIIVDLMLFFNNSYAKMLQWYPWGDCPPNLTNKVAEVILILWNKGIPQYGFTRNKKLWAKVPKKENLNIGLTVDDLREAKKISKQSGKMIAHPDFKTGYAEMIFDGKMVSRCSGWWCNTQTETRISDCTRCLSRSEGCYT